MAYYRNTTINGKIITFSYRPSDLFLRAQQLSQYHAVANKDKEGNEPLDITFSDDHREYFDKYCPIAMARISAHFIKVNSRLVIPSYYFSGSKSTAVITVSDYGFVKDSLLSNLEPKIEDAIVNHVLFQWYMHLGQPKIAELFMGSVVDAENSIQEGMFQFLRRFYIDLYSIRAIWSNFYCEQADNFTMEAVWSNYLCEQAIKDWYKYEVLPNDPPSTE